MKVFIFLCLFMANCSMRIDAQIQVRDRLTGVQFEDLRRQLDSTFIALADSLSRAFYQQRPLNVNNFRRNNISFQDSILDLITFNRFHGLLWNHYDVRFHNRNQSRQDRTPIPEREYNIHVLYNAQGDSTGFIRRSALAQDKINQAQVDGFRVILPVN